VLQQRRVSLTAACSPYDNERMRSFLITALAFCATTLTAQSPEELRLHNDWAYLARYRDANHALAPAARGEKRVVFMGDSITEGWARYFDAQFPGKPYVNRGISGQTTPQMLVRFRQDVVALHPSAVVILAGINDLAGNTGPSTVEMIEDNLASMAEIAKANNIAVVLCSILPANHFAWRPGVAPAPDIVRINAWMKQYAARHGATFVDYHAAMADAELGLPASLSPDGVHPNEAGYRMMAPIVQRGIDAALKSKR
jgi:acyl-CoA thioesterase-1